MKLRGPLLESTLQSEIWRGLLSPVRFITETNVKIFIIQWWAYFLKECNLMRAVAKFRDSTTKRKIHAYTPFKRKKTVENLSLLNSFPLQGTNDTTLSTPFFFFYW